MKTLYKMPLLGDQPTEEFKSILLDDKTVSGASSNWSVKSYTLRGGSQEGVQVVEINNGKLSFAVLPTRGMGIWKGQYRDIALGWNSPVKDPVHPSFVHAYDCGGIGWLKGFNEWIVRCGLSSMGPPCTDTRIDENGNTSSSILTLHGNIANTPARSVSIEITDEAIIVSGEVDETMLFGPCLRLSTEIRTELSSGALTITDTVTNLSDQAADHELLCHINYGEPLLEKGSRLLAPFKQVAPHTARAAEGIKSFDHYAAPQVGFAEQVYLYELIGKRGSGETMTMLRNSAGNQAAVLRFSLQDFPCFVQWKNTAGKADGYVTGIEPSTNYPNTRQFERENGRLIRLAAGESRTTTLVVETLHTKKAVSAAEDEIKKLQKTVKPKVHRQPLAHFSAQ